MGIRDEMAAVIERRVNSSEYPQIRCDVGYALFKVLLRTLKKHPGVNVEQAAKVCLQLTLGEVEIFCRKVRCEEGLEPVPGSRSLRGENGFSESAAELDDSVPAAKD